MTAYFISGLGADRHIFQKLQLPPELSIIYLDWIEPVEEETLSAYCHRLAIGIDTSKEFVLVGLSFGGMIATELSQILQPKQTIILSSAGSRNELPWYYRLAGTLKLDLLANPSLLKTPTPFTYWFFGVKTKEERLLLQRILKATSPTFLKWSIRCILSWNRAESPGEIFHIHGSKERVLPVRHVKADMIIPAGGHFMVFSLPEIISRILTRKICYG